MDLRRIQLVCIRFAQEPARSVSQIHTKPGHIPGDPVKPWCPRLARRIDARFVESVSEKGGAEFGGEPFGVTSGRHRNSGVGAPTMNSICQVALEGQGGHDLETRRRLELGRYSQFGQVDANSGRTEQTAEESDIERVTTGVVSKYRVIWQLPPTETRAPIDVSGAKLSEHGIYGRVPHRRADHGKCSKIRDRLAPIRHRVAAIRQERAHVAGPSGFGVEAHDAGQAVSKARRAIERNKRRLVVNVQPLAAAVVRERSRAPH